MCHHTTDKIAFYILSGSALFLKMKQMINALPPKQGRTKHTVLWPYVYSPEEHLTLTAGAWQFPGMRGQCVLHSCWKSFSGAHVANDA